MGAESIKVLLDTDIGSDIDDALALAYLLCQPRCELLGVTTVSGEPQQRAEMVSALCRHAGRDDVPIHSGCAQALLAQMRQQQAPQAEALSAWARRRDFEPNTAVEFLRRTIRAHPGEVVLLAIGPLTNIGLLFATDPELPALLRGLTLMCGQFRAATGGEWNATNDPHATAIVYGAGRQARPPRHVSFGLDVTMRCAMAAEDARQRLTARVLQPVRDFAEVWFRRAPRIVWHDPLAAACVFEPDLCRYTSGTVRVSLSEPTLGWTVFEPGGVEPPHTVAVEVDPPRFFEHYFHMVK